MRFVTSTASAQQLLTRRFDSAAEALGDGGFSFRLGGHLDKGLSLAELNGGAGVERGKIRITDRTGATSTIDLSYAVTVDFPSVGGLKPGSPASRCRK